MPESKTATDRRIVFMACNNHVGDCGPPPAMSNRDSDNYYGYFENRHGEQFVFRCNRDTKEIELRGGDCEWKTDIPVLVMSIDALMEEAKTAKPIKVPPLPGSKRARAGEEYVIQPPKLEDLRAYFESDELQWCVRLCDGRILATPGYILSNHELKWLASCYEAALRLNVVRKRKEG